MIPERDNRLAGGHRWNETNERCVVCLMSRPEFDGHGEVAGHSVVPSILVRTAHGVHEVRDHRRHRQTLFGRVSQWHHIRLAPERPR
jgi:hypothetical protein